MRHDTTFPTTTNLLARAHAVPAPVHNAEQFVGRRVRTLSDDKQTQTDKHVGIDKGVVVYTYSDCKECTDRSDRLDRSDRSREDLFSPECETDLLSCVSGGSNASR